MKWWRNPITGKWWEVQGFYTFGRRLGESRTRAFVSTLRHGWRG